MNELMIMKFHLDLMCDHCHVSDTVTVMFYLGLVWSSP